MALVSLAGETTGDSSNAATILTAAYPQTLIQSSSVGEILWRDGTRMPLDNGLTKATFEDLLNNASLHDQVNVYYPVGWPFELSWTTSDPGRVRNEAFLRKMYGDTQASVERHLVEVAWPEANSPGRVRFTSINGAADALAAVREELGKLGPAALRLVSKVNGTFNWRPIAGTQRLSMHSFGAAIDFDLPDGLSRYWRWDASAERRYPARMLDEQALGAVVCAFERHGFIWGGKWGHYDTVHFEYRPELVAPRPAMPGHLAKTR